MWVRLRRWIVDAIGVTAVGNIVPSVGGGLLAAAAAGIAAVNLASAPWPLILILILGVFLVVTWLVALFVTRVLHLGGPIAAPTAPVGPPKPESINDVSQTYFRGRSIRITDLTENSDLLEDKIFEECFIQGPAILAVMDGTSIDHCRFITPIIESTLYEIVLPRRVVGAVALKGCTFRRCDFYRIGFAAPKETLAAFRHSPTLTEAEAATARPRP